MENCLIKKTSFGVDVPENGTMGVLGGGGGDRPLGTLVTPRQHISSGAQQSLRGTFTSLMSGLGTG